MEQKEIDKLMEDRLKASGLNREFDYLCKINGLLAICFSPYVGKTIDDMPEIVIRLDESTFSKLGTEILNKLIATKENGEKYGCGFEFVKKTESAYRKLRNELGENYKPTSPNVG